MNLSNTDFIYLKENLSKVPIVVLAKKFNMAPLEFCKMLRTTGISTIIKDIELQYMKDCEEAGVPSKKVKETLGTSSTQFSQICSRHGFKQLRALQDISIDDVKRNTKWLIEEELKMDLDDFLPVHLRQGHFTKSGLSDCLRYANHIKKSDSYFKNFSAVAYLVCKTFPDHYRPFQFSHSKTNTYYQGKDGKKNYLQDLAWVIEEKMGLKLSDIDIYVTNQLFLRTRDLAFYGLGLHTYKHLFDSIEDIKNELVKIYGIHNGKSDQKTEKLRLKLLEANYPYECAVENCINVDPHVHHIIPKRNKKGLSKYKVDFDDDANLVFLCPNHHNIADKVDWKPLLEVASDKRREMLLDLLNNKI